MNPYLLTSIIFTLILSVVYMFVSLPRTIYLPNTTEGAPEDVETRKKKAARVRSRTFVFGIGGTVVACLATMLVIWISGPVKKVYAVFNASPTPTITLTPTASNTPTPRPTRTPTATGDGENFLTMIAGTSSEDQMATSTLSPSGSTSGGGSTTVIQTRIVSVVQTRIVSYTQIIYVPVTVIVTATFTPTPEATYTKVPTIASVMDTITATFTPTFTATPSETPTP